MSNLVITNLPHLLIRTVHNVQFIACVHNNIVGLLANKNKLFIYSKHTVPITSFTFIEL